MIKQKYRSSFSHFWTGHFMAKFLSVLVLFYFCFFINTQASAQNPVVVVHLHSPPPSRMNIEMLWSVDLINSGSPREVYLFGVAKETKTGLWIADGTSIKFTIPKGFTKVNPADIGPISYHANSQYDETVTRTGGVPAGNYTICMYVLDAKTNDTLGMDCVNNHVVLNVTCSQLIRPSNSKTITEKLPTFIWTPISPTVPVSDVSYSLKIVEIDGRQTPYDAMQSNPIWFDVDDISVPLCSYPLSAENLQPGVSYGWQVTAFAQQINGEKVELCKSEVWSFTVAVPKADTSIVQNTDTVNPDLSHTDTTNKISQTDTTNKVPQEKKIGIISDQGRDTSNKQIVIHEHGDSLHAHQVLQVDSAKKVNRVILGAEKTNPKTEICKTLKAKLSSAGQERSYKFIITNNDSARTTINSHVGDPPPVSVRVNLRGDSIIAIEGALKEWERTPSKFPPGSSIVKWTSASGAIPFGETNLGILKFANLSRPVTAMWEWLDKNDKVLCKDSTMLGESIAYYELSDEPSDVVVEVPDDVLHVQYLNNYASSNDLGMHIFDTGSQEDIKTKSEKTPQINSITGLNRINIPLKEYSLTSGKSYILTLSDSKNAYYFNFKITKDKAINDR